MPPGRVAGGCRLRTAPLHLVLRGEAESPLLLPEPPGESVFFLRQPGQLLCVCSPSSKNQQRLPGTLGLQTTRLGPPSPESPSSQTMHKGPVIFATCSLAFTIPADYTFKNYSYYLFTSLPSSILSSRAVLSDSLSAGCRCGGQERGQRICA